jgi:hypothetical protein
VTGTDCEVNKRAVHRQTERWQRNREKKNGTKRAERRRIKHLRLGLRVLFGKPVPSIGFGGTSTSHALLHMEIQGERKTARNPRRRANGSQQETGKGATHTHTSLGEMGLPKKERRCERLFPAELE